MCDRFAVSTLLWLLEFVVHNEYRAQDHQRLLRFPAPYICIKIKINLNCYFHIYGASKGFMKGFKAFIKPFEAPGRCVKIKIEVDFSSSSEIGTVKVKILYGIVWSVKYMQSNKNYDRYCVEVVSVWWKTKFYMKMILEYFAWFSVYNWSL